MTYHTWFVRKSTPITTADGVHERWEMVDQTGTEIVGASYPHEAVFARGVAKVADFGGRLVGVLNLGEIPAIIIERPVQ